MDGNHNNNHLASPGSPKVGKRVRFEDGAASEDSSTVVIHKLPDDDDSPPSTTTAASSSSSSTFTPSSSSSSSSTSSSTSSISSRTGNAGAINQATPSIINPPPGRLAPSFSRSTTLAKKVLIIHFGDEVKRIAYTERAPAEAIERSIRRECGLIDAESEFSILDSEGDSLVLDGSMEPGEVWLTTEQQFAAKIKKAQGRHSTSFSPSRPVPRFDSLPLENAIIHNFNCDTGEWIRQNTMARLDSVPFASGSLRRAYYMQEMSDPSTVYVAKLSIDPNEDKETYFQDVETQMYARKWAHTFNSYHPPKQVSFVLASVMTLPDRPVGQQLWAVEKYIIGSYRKHNNNYGYVSEAERNTPQAFSHFTYEASDHTMLICDIQGVGDMYTDPQMHTVEGMPVIGKGNLGSRGFEKFLSTHQCNAICVYLKLPLVNRKALDIGTRPDRTYMAGRRVEPMKVDVKKNELNGLGPKKSSGAGSSGGSFSRSSQNQAPEREGLLSSSSSVDRKPASSRCCCIIQ
eukprot:TRINITY_DN2361_c1_g1_i1.p1 TRINITY_DN2361_c1_g1~~TRINITY_DN2361_c1_g1_i1.p1  ORF type:complete len:516 (+),score=114.51 TRINITY_DN2361_c1_g1_i1:75-1622(+)